MEAIGMRDYHLSCLRIEQAYRNRQESPFYLFYGRDPQLPTSEMLEPQIDRVPYNLDDYKTEMVKHTSGAWKLARENVKCAQMSQKKHYDKTVQQHKIKQGDSLCLHAFSKKVKLTSSHDCSTDHTEC